MADAIPVLVNRTGGTATRLGDRLEEDLRAAFEAAGLAIDLHLIEGSAVASACEQRKGAPLVVVGGGDGTLACGADAFAGSDTALGILPLGTRNHLARDLGIPNDLPGAAKLIAERTARRIDLGRVNGHVFVNNASVGLYPQLVRAREVEQERHGLPKWVAALPASFAALKRLRHHRLRLAMPGQEREVVTPLLFVGNNPYDLRPGHVGARAALDRGVLAVYAVRSWHRIGLIGFAVRTLLGRSDPARDFAAIGETERMTVNGPSRAIHIALDGEVQQLTLPLEFTSEAGTLTVIAPGADA